MTTIRPEVVEMIVDAELMFNRLALELLEAQEAARSYRPTPPVAESLSDDEMQALNRLVERIHVVRFVVRGATR